MAIVLVLLLGINVLRMWRNVMKDSGAGIGSYLAALPQLPYQFFTQAKYKQCERKRPWAIHLALMLSYVTMLVLIMFFLHQMQSGPEHRLARARVRLPGLGRPDRRRGPEHPRPR